MTLQSPSGPVTSSPSDSRICRPDRFNDFISLQLVSHFTTLVLECFYLSEGYSKGTTTAFLGINSALCQALLAISDSKPV